MFKSFTRAVGVVAVSAVFLAGCGGGGGGGGGGSSGSSAPTNVQGFAATGAAISGGTVSLKCVSGAVLTTTTAADGSFTLSPSSAQLPCVLRVVSGPTTLYSFVDGFGRLNATPLSDLVLAHAGADTPANIYAGFNTTLATTIRAGLAAAKTYLTAQIRKLDLNPVTIDPLTGTFVVGDAHDVILDQLKAALTANTKTLDDLRTAARTRVDVTTQLPAGSITISEVASGFFYRSPNWFEIANYGSAPVNLDGFTVKTAQAVLNASPFTLSGSTSFSLPNVTIAPGAYLVVRGQQAVALPNSSQVVYISNVVAGGVQVPSWDTGGSIELLKDGVTRAFVRFGTNTSQPTTNPSSYTYTAPALPNTSTTYGNSIVRFGANTTAMNSGINATWSSVAWTTPAGPNDVPAGAVDADGDGIPDSAEVNGGKFAGLDLYAMGARTGVRDILIEVDYMASSDPGVTPRKQALDNVKAAFSANSVNMIIDAGGLFGDAANTGYNWGGGQSVPSASCVYLGPNPNGVCAGDLYKYKAQYFDVRRNAIFHYALFGISQEISGVGGSSGIAELPGNDFLVTLGGWNLNTNTTANTNRLINYQAGTFMHELGHNLGLRHGGNEDANYKPNYFSVMNYLYQLNGLSSNAAGIGPYQRWVCAFYPSSCVLAESASTSNSMVINFSNGSSVALNEALLSEVANIGRSADVGVYADWNRSGSLTGGTVSVDINGSASLSTLNDFNDWSNIVWPFARTVAGSFGARLDAPSAPERTFDAMSDDRQPFIVETLRAPAH